LEEEQSLENILNGYYQKEGDLHIRWKQHKHIMDDRTMKGDETVSSSRTNRNPFTMQNLTQIHFTDHNFLPKAT
jgi:hypothetical protein